MKKKTKQTNKTPFWLGVTAGALIIISLWLGEINKNLERQIGIMEEHKRFLQEEIQILKEMQSEPTTNERLQETPPKISQKWSGVASYYSTEGCEGCRSDRRMKNGEILDENAMTLAFNHLPMNTTVTVKNVDTNQTVIAKVTDTGGFNQRGRDMYYEATGIVIENDLNRIADISKGVKEAIGCTDLCEVEVIQ